MSEFVLFLCEPISCRKCEKIFLLIRLLFTFPRVYICPIKSGISDLRAIYNTYVLSERNMGLAPLRQPHDLLTTAFLIKEI